MGTLSAKHNTQQAPSLAPFGRLVWMPKTEEKRMVFIQAAGLTRVQIDRSRPSATRPYTQGIGWWQLALRGLFRRNSSL